MSVHDSREMMAVLHTLKFGMRSGEICALEGARIPDDKVPRANADHDEC